MKKRLLALTLTATMACGLAACGGSDDSNKPASDGKVLNIYCWNNEFRNRLTDHYKNYTKVSETEGKIGDITVVWHETPNADNGYQNALDAALKAQDGAAADDKVDLFLVEADYAGKYVNTDYTLDIMSLGVTKDDLKNQYKYTQDAVTDASGVLKGVSWQGCPCVTFFRTDIAEKVLGTKDPTEVQNYISDWTKFEETAQKMKDAGYKMVSGYDDTYRVFSNNSSSAWVVDGKIVISPEVKQWVDQTKKWTDAGFNNKTKLWDEAWSAGFLEAGDVFCYMGPAWLADYCMRATEKDADGNVTKYLNDGLWNAAEGPQAFFWGGTWMCAAKGTDNADAIKEIIIAMSCDSAVSKEIAEKDNDFANNSVAMKELSDSGFKSDFLGGQNPLPLYMANVDTINLGKITAYDQGCNEEFQKAMHDYFDGNATYEEALEAFYTAVTTKYPELTK